ncbi:MAG: four helix bundle protein [Chloroflexi bacterium]|nr:MAG: four helix bundle protein [Chloroflexota bacterium]
MERGAQSGSNGLSPVRKGALAKDFGLKDQLRRAAVSVMTNIAEGFDCDSGLEFTRFLGIARRSAVEVQSLLYAVLDVRYITQAEFDEHYEQARKAKALAGGFKRSLIKKHASRTQGERI